MDRTSGVPIPELLQKCSHFDADERYMATNDLSVLLAKDIKIDDVTEKNICTAVLAQLDDASNDVQSVAVKCLGTLVKKAKAAQIGDISDKLCSLILDGNAALRDIYAIGLKTLIGDVPDDMGDMLASKLIAKLIAGITRQTQAGSTSSNDDTKRECLDILSDFLKRFGHTPVAALSHEDIMAALVRQLSDVTSNVVLKRTALCLSSLAVVLSDQRLNILVERLLDKINHSNGGGNANSVQSRTLIQTIGAIARTAGFRLGRQLDRLIPLLIQFCGDADSESESDNQQQLEAANEMRETCFPGLESFVLRCYRDTAPFIPAILKVSLAFMKYDPNYSYGDEDGEDGDGRGDDEDMDEGDGDDYDEDDYGGGSDDEDSSWKIRKAAIKVIIATISSTRDVDALLRLYSGHAASVSVTADGLIGRFKEREENVKLDVIKSFHALLGATLTHLQSKGRESAESLALLAAVESKLPKLMSATTKLLLPPQSKRSSQNDASSAKVKASLFAMLQTLLLIFESAAGVGSLTAHVPAILASADRCLKDRSQDAPKLDALQLTRCVLETSGARGAPSDLSDLLLTTALPMVLIVFTGDNAHGASTTSGANHSGKFIAEGLRLLAAYVTVSRPEPGASPTNALQQSTAHQLFGAILPRLRQQDIDLEIKETAMLTVARLFATFGDVPALQAELTGVLEVLRKRLDNDVTRMAALQAFSLLANSPLSIDLLSSETGVMAGSAVVDIANFLRQQNRALKQLTLTTLAALVASTRKVAATAAHPSLSSDTVGAILRETSPLVSDADLSLAHLALALAKTVALAFPSYAEAVITEVYPAVTVLVRSPLLQGAALSSTIELLQTLATVGSPETARLTVAHVMATLYIEPIQERSSSSGVPPKKAMFNIARAIAAVCLSSSSSAPAASGINPIIAHFLGELTAGDDVRKQASLICIGEFGRSTDLAGFVGLKDTVLGCFESASEDVKAAAAYALGHLAIGNMPLFLPIVLGGQGTGSHQYLLLSSLKELITVFVTRGQSFLDFLGAVLPHCEHFSRAEEEGVRNLVAECLGSLTALHSNELVGFLRSLADNKADILGRWTVVTALRNTLARQHQPSFGSWVPIQSTMGEFLALANDANLDIRKATLLLINTAIHHNPAMIATFLKPTDGSTGIVLGRVLETLRFKQKKIIDLGPFKHEVDEGLPLRKVAIACVETLLASQQFSELLDITALVPCVGDLLADKDDSVKLSAHQLVLKLCTVAPVQLSGAIDALKEPLEKAAGKSAPASKGDQQAVGLEAERAHELIRSAKRVLKVLAQLHERVANGETTFAVTEDD